MQHNQTLNSSKINNFRVFLIRESKSKCGSFVLTFKCGGKIVHTPIIAVCSHIIIQFGLYLMKLLNVFFFFTANGLN